MAITEQQRNLLKRSIAELRQLRARLAEIEAAASAPVSIVGMSCRLPGGADSLQGYWQMLRDGVDAVGPVPEHRWPVERWFDPDPEAPGKMYSRWGAFLDDLDQFDARFFGISPREARSMDPQQRLLLEVCWEALEDAGQTEGALRESRTGVFIGALNRDYLHVLRAHGGAHGIDAYSASGHHNSVLSGRIAHTLGLRGPCLTLDTACSSSLAAVHLAVQSLRAGDCDLAIAGGVNVILAPETFIERCKNRMLSPHGRCRTFDDAANGIVVGEGCGLVVLRRAADAQADGDRVRARIIGTALNHDGHTSGLTVPSGPAQRELLRDALRNARLDPGAVGYIEAHGTGTPLGDPIELNALVQALRPDGDAACEPLRVGSVKTNLGHLESAAGIAGLIKAALAIEHGEIPAHLHFETGNRNFDWASAPLEIPRTTTPWQPADGRRVAGVSSFGFAGTNVHLLLDDAETATDPEPSSGEVPALVSVHRPRGHLLLLSAREPAALSALADRWRERLEAPDADEALDDLLYTAAHRRSHHRERAAVVGADRAALVAALQRQEIVATRADAKPARCVFVFSGQGSQWPGMGLDLMRTEPVFELAMRECESAFRAVDPDFSVLDELRLAAEATHLSATEVAQPAIFAVEVALARLWQSWGVRPAAVLGHSIGELAAAHVAGMFDLQRAAELVLRRGRAMARGNGQGAMLAVGLGAGDVEALIAEHGDAWLELAAVNSPRACVLVGDPAALETVRAELSERNVFARFLRVDTPFHSRVMETSRASFVNAFGGLDPELPGVPFYSSVLGRRLEEHEPAGIEYWGRNLRDTVRFADAMKALVDDGFDLVLEVGPHPVLSASIQQCLSEAGHGERVVTSLRRDHDGPLAMLEQAGRLHTLGAELDLDVLVPRQGRRVATLPTYPWQRGRHWIDAPRRGHDASGNSLGIVPGSGWWMARKLDTALPTIEAIVEPTDPAIVARAWGSARIVDATAMLEAALHGHACLDGEPEHLELSDMTAPPEAAWLLAGHEQLALQIVGDVEPGRDGLQRLKLFVEDTEGGWRPGLALSVHRDTRAWASLDDIVAGALSLDALPDPTSLPLPTGWQLVDGPGASPDGRWLHVVVQPDSEASCPNLLTGCLRVAGGIVEQLHGGIDGPLALLERFDSMRCHVAGLPERVAAAGGRMRIEIGLDAPTGPGAWPVTTIVARPETTGGVAPCLVVRGARWSSTAVGDEAIDETLHPVADAATGSTRGQLAAMSRQARVEWLEDCLRERVRGLMMLPPELPIAADEGFFQMGMDSLMAVALKTGLEATFGLELPMTLAFERPTIAALADELAVRLATAIEQEPLAASPPPRARVRTTPATRPPIAHVELAINDDGELPVPAATTGDASLHDLLDLLEDELDD